MLEFLLWRWSTWRHKSPWKTWISSSSRLYGLIHYIIKLWKHDSSTVTDFGCLPTMLIKWSNSRFLCRSISISWWWAFYSCLLPVSLSSTGIHEFLIISQRIMSNILNKILASSKVANELILSHDFLPKSTLLMLAIGYKIDKGSFNSINVIG